MSNRDTSPACPICACPEFLTFNGRPNAVCANCKSFERSRLLWLALTHLLDLTRSDLHIAHFAPEKGIARALTQRLGNRYEPFDIDPTRYDFPFIEVQEFNLCTDAQNITPGHYDAVIHVHVMEHLFCDHGKVLRDLHCGIKPGGIHLFGIPIIGLYFAEDRNPAMPPDKRASSFGQDDHVRRFGVKDVEQHLEHVLSAHVHRAETHIDPVVLKMAAADAALSERPNSHTIFFVHQSTEG